MLRYLMRLLKLLSKADAHKNDSEMHNMTQDQSSPGRSGAAFHPLRLLLIGAVLLGIAAAHGRQLKGVAGQVQNAPLVGAVWAYDWGSGMPKMPSGVEYVPMSWGYYGASKTDTVNWVEGLKAAGALDVLAFNEPDNSTQSNLSVQTALQGYSYLSAGPLPVISPGCMDDSDSWMQSFMAGAESAGLNVPAVAVHAYQSTASSFLGYIDWIYSLYGKPLWITEFAPTDWQSPTGVSATACIQFINTVLPALATRPYVARYSWYCGTEPGVNVLGTAALFNPDNTLTAVGMAYAHPGRPSPLPSGAYKIVNRNSGKALTVLNGHAANRSAVVQEPYTGNQDQQWMLADLGNGLYKISGIGSGRSLDVYGDAIPNGSTVDIYDYYNIDCMTWYVEQTSAGYYCIIGVGGGKALDVYNSSTNNGATVDAWSYHGGHNQEWEIVPVPGYAYPQPGNAYRVVNVGSGLCLNSPNLSATPGTYLDQYTANSTIDNGANQLWIINQLFGSANYALTNVFNGLAVDDYNWSTTSGSLIDEWTYSGQTVQQWQVNPAGLGSFTLTSQSSGLVLAVAGSSRQNDGSIVQETPTGAKNELWTFEPVADWPQAGHAYRLVNVGTDLVLESPGAAKAPGALLDQSEFSSAIANGTNQQWLPNPVFGAAYAFTNIYTGLAVDDYNWSTSPGSLIDEWTSSGQAVQQWQVKPVGSGEYALINLNSRLVLGVQGGSHSSGASIDQEAYNGGLTQLWRFELVQAPLSSFSASPSTVVGGNVVTAGVTLGAPAPIGGECITVQSNNKVVGAGTISIGPGATSGSVALSTAAVTSSTIVKLTVTASGVTKTATVTVQRSHGV